MRKLFALLLVAALHLSATVNAGMQWDVRSTGSDSNGGGYDATVAAPGTDFSQQDAAQVSYTDLVIGATTTQATSAAFPFDSTTPGNVVNIISGTGCTVGRHEALSVSGTTATFSESLGTAGSTCTAKLGGSLLTLPTAVIPAATTNKIHLKFATYTYTTQQVLSPTASGTTIYITGYTTTHGDGAPSRPTITTATNGVDLIGFSTTRSTWTLVWSKINVTSTAATPGNGIVDVNSANAGFYGSDFLVSGFSNCINFGGVSRGTYWEVNSTSLFNVELKSCSSNGFAFFANASGVQAFVGPGTYIHNMGAAGILAASGGSGVGLSMTRGIIAANGAKGIAFSGSGCFLNLSQSDIASNTGDGVTLSSGGTCSVALDDDIIYGNTGWGLNASGGSTVTLRWNRYGAYGSNTSGDRTGIAASSDDLALTANPFTSATNFTLNNATGGGALLKGAGFPGAFAGSTTTGSLDIGAVQSTCVSASAFACGFSELLFPARP
jgi:hypothetical protein